MQAGESKKIDLANHASGRYKRCAHEIEHIKSGIFQNRKGTLRLTEISQNTDKLNKRIRREGLPVDKALERINGVPNFQDVYIIEKVLRLSKAVCRINIVSDYGVSGYGSGFLIAPGFIITNNHVIDHPEKAKTSFAQFNYELSETKKALPPITFNLRPDIFFMTSSLEKDESPHSGLDFTIVAVDETSNEGYNMHDMDYARLDESLGKIIEGENCIVIQHPAGDYKKIVLKDIRMLTLVDDFLVYESDTLPGSSGSIVIGLGTGEVVALHHSGVPRRNEHGEWLRKDGLPFQPGDPDEAIDWLGNEGIRVSSIVRTIRNMPLPANMESTRQKLLHASKLATPDHEPVKIETDMTPDTPPGISTPSSAARTQYFEAELVDEDSFRDDFLANASKYIPGFKTKERLFPYSTLASQRNMYYLQVQTDKNPWEAAEAIEALPHITSCTPDLPAATDVGIGQDHLPTTLTESAVKDFMYNDGTASWNEETFLTRWSKSVCYSDAIKLEKDFYRQWNWVAVKWPKVQNDAQWSAIKDNLKTLRLTQLDTGYSHHSKVKNGYDFTLDMDFIDNDQDARDEQARLVFKFPNHGSRTASLVIGEKISEAFEYDGNRGILTENDKSLIKLVPYRIAKTVVLIGRGKDMVAAANHAINNKTDVMFMCMGSYPRPMIEEVARAAYEKGVIWVCAAGNEVEMVVAPALYPGTIAVAGINPDLKPWSGSSNGPAVDIAAPGESVYVPFVDKDGKEIMCYGDGTSYATPHVAAAAMLWKAKHKDQLAALYSGPWQIVEAFRTCLKQSAHVPDGWKNDKYGAGILDIPALLSIDLPAAASLTHAYAGKSKKQTDLGVRETVHFLWNTLKRKLKPGVEESVVAGMPLSSRGRMALSAMSGKAIIAATESATTVTESQKKKILADYFESQQ